MTRTAAILLVILFFTVVFWVSGCSSLSGKLSNERTLTLLTEDCKKLSLIMDFDTAEDNKAEKNGQIPTGLLTGAPK